MIIPDSIVGAKLLGEKKKSALCKEHGYQFIERKATPREVTEHVLGRKLSVDTPLTQGELDIPPF